MIDDHRILRATASVAKPATGQAPHASNSDEDVDPNDMISPAALGSSRVVCYNEDDDDDDDYDD